MRLPLALMKEAEMEGYIYFDEKIRKLPRKKDGSIDTVHSGFHDNDVDAFRHAYVSGIFRLEYGEKVAQILGWMNEFMAPSSKEDQNMDLWNNAVGRSLAAKHKTKDALLSAVKSSLINGELITRSVDKRVYEGAQLSKPRDSDSVIVLKESETGANEMFFDFEGSRGMTRSEFVEAIAKGFYPGYEIRKINGVEYPVSKRDGSNTNNLG